MAIIQDPRSNTCLAVDPSFDAVRGSIRSPNIDGGGGYYRTSLLSGTIATLAAGSIFFAFRNQFAQLAVIQNVTVGFRAVAGSASTSFVVSMYATRSYTATETTGIATAPVLKGDVMTMSRSTQMNSLLRIANTGAISGGTGTDDSQPLGSLVFTHPGAVSNVGLYTQPIFQQVGGNSSSGQQLIGVAGGEGGYSSWFHPLVLAQNEGFRLRADTSPIAGTNTLVAYVAVDWFETSTF